jgi:hypothetical protein
MIRTAQIEERLTADHDGKGAHPTIAGTFLTYLCSAPAMAPIHVEFVDKNLELSGESAVPRYRTAHFLDQANYNL